MTHRAAEHRAAEQRAAANRRGLSILEVMLAIAILGASLAAIGQLVSLGARGAEGARHATKAAVLCENKMSELVVGLTPLAPTSGQFEEDPEWSYQIDVATVDQTGLLNVMVEARPTDDAYAVPFRLHRFVVDPLMRYPPPEEEEEEDLTATTEGGL